MFTVERAPEKLGRPYPGPAGHAWARVPVVDIVAGEHRGLGIFAFAKPAAWYLRSYYLAAVA
jgi:hypothetical protein